MTLEVLFLLACAAIAAFWYDSMRAREAALDGARRATEAAACQLLDATVALASLRPVREEGGMLRLRRIYRFEFRFDQYAVSHDQVTVYFFFEQLYGHLLLSTSWKALHFHSDRYLRSWHS
jgi:hypothetical protein